VTEHEGDDFVVDKYPSFCFPEGGMKAKTKTEKQGRGQAATDGTELSIRVVEAGEVKRYDELMEAKHYLGRAHRVGDFLRQVVERDGQWIALLAWGPASLHLRIPGGYPGDSLSVATPVFVPCRERLT
jgi:hypothetical protein